jgi:hypothetical protein
MDGPPFDSNSKMRAPISQKINWEQFLPSELGVPKAVAFSWASREIDLELD